MTKPFRIGLNWRSLRFRLVGWYLVLLVLSLAVFSVYIFFQFRSLEQNQQDTTLQAAASSVLPLVDARPGGNAGGQTPRFRLFNNVPIIQDLNIKGVRVRLLDRDGDELDTLGSSVSDMPKTAPTSPGFLTINTASSGQWRILNLPVAPGIGPGGGNPNGNRDGGNFGGMLWVQVGQPIFALNAEVGRLFTPILLGTLLALFFALLGGLFLANRALSPIDRVTRTAQAISTQDLAKRISYNGPADEIGRLAKTLDQMLDRLEKGFEQERRFTADASHELRTPLTALKGRIEVTLSRPRTQEEYQSTLEDLNHEVNRLVRLSNSLLYLARLDQAGHNSWQSETLSLSDLLESVVDSLEAVAELKQINLRADIPADVEIDGNLDQLTRLFVNLLDNAIKYTPQGGTVNVRLEKLEKNQKIAILISDNGLGIAAEHLPHLFERFYRAQTDRASSSGGAGLGLAIAYEIARQHGGTIEVESQLGQGTTFKIQLPL